MTDVKKSIELLFDRPSEPLFMPKGENGTVFDVSPEFLSPQYESLGTELTNRFGEDASERIPIKSISPPDLSVALQLPRQAEFTLIIPKHRKIAASLLDIFLSVPQGALDDFLATAAFCRDKVNTQLFNYCLSVALLHREDTRDIPLPNFMESFPSKFVDSQVFQQAREITSIVPAGLRSPIVIPKDFTATDIEEEHRMFYFREDIGINLHHWHWHLVYPFEASDSDISIVAKDRRGELFYYMHQQIIARYNADRLSNNLGRVKRFNNFTDPIKEGYYPKLDSLTSGRAWSPRQANMVWQNVTREVDEIDVSVNDLETWRSRIDAAISSGVVETADGQSLPLTIDMLGNMMESSVLSPDQNFYGDFHNSGHILTAYVHDPQHKYLELFGVMADEATTMRDPFFYRWHALIDSLFQKFKNSQRSYTRAELSHPTLQVRSIGVSEASNPRNVNTLNTFWMQSDVDLSRGLDFTDRGAVLVRFTHLNHNAFNYNIVVNNTGDAVLGTVRIFMAPKLDERELPWQLNDQRVMFIELDRFVQQFTPGENRITRRSEDSSVTIPFERTFRNLQQNPRESSDAARNFNFCGCGWPQHMLIPKGSPGGTAFQLFVMVSNYQLDQIDQNIDGVPCADASSFCGIQNRLYPDRRDMGFPFDKPPAGDIGPVEDFLQPNMAIQDITIRFTDRTVQNPRNPQSS